MIVRLFDEPAATSQAIGPSRPLRPYRPRYAVFLREGTGMTMARPYAPTVELVTG